MSQAGVLYLMHSPHPHSTEPFTNMSQDPSGSWKLEAAKSIVSVQGVGIIASPQGDGGGRGGRGGEN